MENPIKMDDLEVPPFKETSIWCAMMTYTKNSAGDSWWSLRRTLRPRIATVFAGKTTPCKPGNLPQIPAQQKNKKNIQQQPKKNTTIQKSQRLFFSDKFFTSLLNCAVSQDSSGVQQRET